MRVAVYSTKPYDREFLGAAAAGTPLELHFLESRLDATTAALAAGHDATCVFVNDDASAPVLSALQRAGVSVLALRSAGYNHVDVVQARRLGFTVSHVPAYSPHAVAEHAVGLILALDRHLIRAASRVREGNYALAGLLGFDLHGRTVGVVGTGAIGAAFCRIMLGFGCTVVAFDVRRDAALESAGVTYAGLDDVFARADIVSLHCPLTEDTFHIVDAERLAKMRHGAMLINTSRGALVDADAAIGALKMGRLGYLGLDVYEEEGPLFFEDRSANILDDDTFARLLTFPNVLITGHQAFFTADALHRICEVTVANLLASDRGQRPPFVVPGSAAPTDPT
jgi:D-lactate dehydrogenase